MMNAVRSFDAVVVGGGPAGCSAAGHLARSGFSVLVIDRTTFPRDKACSDGITARAAEHLRRMDPDLLNLGYPVRGGGAYQPDYPLRRWVARLLRPCGCQGDTHPPRQLAPPPPAGVRLGPVEAGAHPVPYVALGQPSRVEGARTGECAQRAVAHGLRPFEQRPDERLLARSGLNQPRGSLP